MHTKKDDSCILHAMLLSLDESIESRHAMNYTLLKLYKVLHCIH